MVADLRLKVAAAPSLPLSVSPFLSAISLSLAPSSSTAPPDDGGGRGGDGGVPTLWKVCLVSDFSCV